ncbi:MAG: PIG-L deacetylase family protein [Planctomycetota bacterium]|jgi:LmbE family N-acetylglucosaminyl deacetylase
MKSVLAIAAHPDDESFLFGGALALHAARGGRAALLCLTDGQAGRTGGLVEQEGLAEVRREELRRAVEVLGIPELYLAGLMDGALDEVGDERGTAIVASYISRFGADILLTFGPEGASGHADHKACFRWTMAAAGERPVYVASHPDSDPKLARGGPPLPVTTVIDISSLGDRKRRAFLEHKTQQDHLELYDRIMTAFKGAEYYHRIRPPWRKGDPLESSLIR